MRAGRRPPGLKPERAPFCVSMGHNVAHDRPGIDRAAPRTKASSYVRRGRTYVRHLPFDGRKIRRGIRHRRSRVDLKIPQSRSAKRALDLVETCSRERKSRSLALRYYLRVVAKNELELRQVRGDRGNRLSVSLYCRDFYSRIFKRIPSEPSSLLSKTPRNRLEYR